MINLTTGKHLNLSNVLLVRKNIKNDGLKQEIESLNNGIQKQGLEKAGPYITAVRNIIENGDDIQLDTEIIIPLNKYTPKIGEHTVLKTFCIKNAIYYSYKGNKKDLQNILKDIYTYIQNNYVKVNTPIYYVNLMGLDNIGNDDTEVDIYIGVA